MGKKHKNKNLALKEAEMNQEHISKDLVLTKEKAKEDLTYGLIGCLFPGVILSLILGSKIFPGMWHYIVMLLSITLGLVGIYPVLILPFKNFIKNKKRINKLTILKERQAQLIVQLKNNLNKETINEEVKEIKETNNIIPKAKNITEQILEDYNTNHDMFLNLLFSNSLKKYCDQNYGTNPKYFRFLANLLISDLPKDLKSQKDLTRKLHK